MQRVQTNACKHASRDKLRDLRRSAALRRERNRAHPQPPRPERRPRPSTYPLRVRNTPAENRVAWATFAKAARESARDGRGMSQSELGRQLKVDRVTVWRWENGQQRPENSSVVARFAEILEVDLDEALAAASLRPDVEPPKQPTRERDEELEEILTADLPQAVRQDLIQTLLDEREADKQRRIAHIQRLIRAERRRAS